MNDSDSFGLIQIDSDWGGLIFNWFATNEIENFFWIGSGCLGLARDDSKWIFIRSFHQSRYLILDGNEVTET